MIALPVHEPCGVSGSGIVDPETMAARCTEQKHWTDRGAMTKAKGCGKLFTLCPRCGCRTVVDGAKCSACNPKEPMGKLA